MAFNTQNFVRTSAGEYSNSQVQADFKYNGIGADDTKAEILAADYFLASYSLLSIGSVITFTSSDADFVFAYVTAATSSTVTLAEMTETLPPGSVDTADIADGAITNAKLGTAAVSAAKLGVSSVTTDKIEDLAVTAGKMAAGLLPINNQLHTTAGGSTTESITISGVVATDVAQVTLNTAGATPITITSCAASAGVVNVVCSADPSTDHIFNVSVFRP